MGQFASLFWWITSITCILWGAGVGYTVTWWGGAIFILAGALILPPVMLAVEKSEARKNQREPKIKHGKQFLAFCILLIFAAIVTSIIFGFSSEEEDEESKSVATTEPVQQPTTPVRKTEKENPRWKSPKMFQENKESYIFAIGMSDSFMSFIGKDEEEIGDQFESLADIEGRKCTDYNKSSDSYVNCYTARWTLFNYAGSYSFLRNLCIKGHQGTNLIARCIVDGIENGTWISASQDVWNSVINLNIRGCLRLDGPSDHALARCLRSRGITVDIPK